MPMRNLLMGLVVAGVGFGQNSLNWNSRVSGDQELTAGERLKLYLHNNFVSPGAAVRALGPALGAQLSGRPKEWDKDGAGFARRVGVNVAMFTTRDTVQAIGTAMQGHDPRYQRCECSGAGRRFRHAFSGMWMMADGQGVRRFDVSNFGAAFAGGFVGASLYPDAYSVRVKGLQLGHQQLAQTLLRNIGVEFGPDIKKFFKQKVLRR
jgi:hypothetical protein